jgi:hypothetical protein
MMKNKLLIFLVSTLLALIFILIIAPYISYKNSTKTLSKNELFILEQKAEKGNKKVFETLKLYYQTPTMDRREEAIEFFKKNIHDEEIRRWLFMLLLYSNDDPRYDNITIDLLSSKLLLETDDKEKTINLLLIYYENNNRSNTIEELICENLKDIGISKHINKNKEVQDIVLQCNKK